jgi:hypothetical protein
VAEKIEPESGHKLALGRNVQGLMADSNAKEIAMFAKLKLASVFAGLICIAVASATNNASAVTAEVAKKCSVLAANEFPPRVIGNPAAGRARGTPQDQRDYFNSCVANGGNIDED